MGEYLLRARLLERGVDCLISSAGLGALVGRPAERFAVEVAAVRGLDLSAHRARQLESRDVSRNELILVMEKWQQTELEKRYPVARGRVHLLGRWNDVEIPDPYRQPYDVFEQTFGAIEECVNLWYEKLWQKQ